MTANSVSGDVLGPSVQAGSIHGDVHLYYHGEPPVERAPQKPTAGWGVLADLPSAVRSLLRAQARDAHRLPYRLPGARRPSLAAVYVRQDLGSGVDGPPSEEVRPTPVLDGRGQVVEVLRAPAMRVAVRPPARTVRAALDADEHLVVTGGAGQGKSTMSLRLASDIAARWCGEAAEDPIAEPVVPLRLTARDLAARLDLPFCQALADGARAEYGAMLGAPLHPDLLADRVVGRRWLLLVDALDEVADAAERDRLVEVLAGWASADSPYRLVVTTRPIGGAALSPLHRVKAMRYELQPFDEEALHCFAVNWFAEEGSEHARRFVRQVREAHLDELARVPLLATIAAIVFQQQGDRPLPDNQYELYEAYLAYLKSARTSTSPFEEHGDTLLEHLGRTRLETDDSLAGAAHDWVRAHLGVGAWRDDLVAFLASVGPLVRHDDELRFLHHSFAEHLAATARARLLPERFSADHDEFAHLLHAARPEERGEHARTVLLHYTRLRPDQADALLGALHAGDAEQHLLAARLLARRAPASRRFLDGFLATARDWAVTTRRPALAIVAQASRATHHPALVNWLTDLVRAGQAPWTSRVEAAAALATRLRGPHSGAAIAFLRDLVDDPDAAVDQRLAAAEALADSGADVRADAERGLRAVLANPLASGYQCRTAAVVLAAFSPEARQCAVDALSALVGSDLIPAQDLVEAATGLVEIGPEFHEVGARAFLGVLTDPHPYSFGRRDAALGLASLGPDRAAEAAALLDALVRDPGRSCVERANAARSLAELGPQHRAAAADHLIAIAAEPGATEFDRAHATDRIADLGLDFRDVAVAHLRTLVGDPRTSPDQVMRSADSLARLGPDLVPEAAAALHALLSDAGVVGRIRVSVLRHLADLDEPHRDPAIRQLRAVLGNPAETPEVRVHAADQLAGAGPEFHTEVSACLRTIATTRHDDAVALRAWRTLVELHPHLRPEALAASLNVMARETPDTETAFHYAPAFAASDQERVRVADALLAVMADRDRGFRSRIRAVHNLIFVGRHFHAAATGWACDLIRGVTVPNFDLPYLGRVFAQVGIGLRIRLAEALREVLLDPDATANRLCHACEALFELGLAMSPEVSTALRTAAADQSADPTVRYRAAALLAWVDPASADVLGDPDECNGLYNWQRAVTALARSGVDVAPSLRALVTAENTHRILRCHASVLLAQLCSGDRDLALAELRRLALEEHQVLWQRMNAFAALVECDPGSADQVIAHHREVLADVQRDAEDKSRAVGALIGLDRAFTPTGLALLRRFAQDVRATPYERFTAVEWLMFRTPSEDEDALLPLVTSITGLPIKADVLRSIVSRLSRRVRTELERDLLADHSLSIDLRVPAPDVWDDIPLADEAEQAVREVLHAPEHLPTERVAAASSLAALSTRHVPEAARALAENSATSARKALAKLSRRHFSYVVTEALAVVHDRACPTRKRRRAAHLITGLTTTPPGEVVDFLREDAANGRTSSRDRVDALFALRRVDGLATVRAVCDDERERPAVRRRAANLLIDYSPADRAAAALVLLAIATDPAHRPALRRHAAVRLFQLGEATRTPAREAMWALARDEDASTALRARALESLLWFAPADRRAVLGTAGELLATDNPLHRAQVLCAIGIVDPTAAALEFARMMRDESVSPVARARCAEFAVKFRRDRKDQAATVMRSIAFDDSVPTHVRKRAARCLARWSEACREEARDLLRRLVLPGP